VNWLKQFGRFNAKCACELDDVHKAYISLSSLDSSNIVAVQICQFGKLFLRQMAVKPEPADALTEDRTRV
jgi:hypothetical protein